MPPLRHKSPDQLPTRPARLQWLVDSLWGMRSVGVIGGEPKTYKTFAALQIAYGVATGAPVFGKFSVKATGPVLIFPAEDAPESIRRRLEGIAAAAGAELAACNDIRIITEAAIRLDTEADRQDLEDTVAELRPRLLILDPFVRLHRDVDENHSGAVAEILGYLRRLNRKYRVAIIVVHHSRKRANGERGGQALRGSGEFHAWVDSGLYMKRRKKGKGIIVEVEHRSEMAIDPFLVELGTAGDAVALRLTDGEVTDDDNEHDTPRQRLLEVLQDQSAPITIERLAKAAGMKSKTAYDEVKTMAADGLLERTSAGVRMPSSDEGVDPHLDS